MKKEITHGYINQKIIEHLDREDFYLESIERDVFTIDVHFIFEGKYDFQFEVKINGTCITKPKEYLAINITNKNEYEFKVIARGNRNVMLQNKFDEWYEGYYKWLNEPDDRLNIMNDYKKFM